MTIICFGCGREVKNGDYTAPWENGKNPHGFITCPYCGYENEDFSDDD